MSATSEYAIRKTAEATYRPRGYGLSPGLRRARAPYRLRNAVTGIAIAGFAVGVWAYSISAVKQDVFDDIDEEAKALVGSGVTSLEDEEKVRKGNGVAFVGAADGMGISQFPSALAPAPTSSSQDGLSSRGFFASRLERWWLDPARKTFIWGAPPVDNVGKVQEVIPWPVAR